MGRTILFSGRFDNVHIGHILTLQRLAVKYDKVIVCILDYPQQYHPIQERLKTMQTALSGCHGNFEVVVNNVHFGVITREDVETLPRFSVYGSGNPVCRVHMLNLGYDSVDVHRTPGYAASDSVKFQKLMKFLEENEFMK